jgi:hypothetical protein
MSAPDQLATVTVLPGTYENEPIDAVAAPLPEYNLQIHDAKPTKPVAFEGGSHHDWTYQLSDGSVFHSRLTLSRQQQYDIGLSHRTPWCTDLNGMYSEVDKEYARRGMTGTRVGPEQTSVVRAARNLAMVLFGSDTQLAHDAYVHHLILDHVDSLGIANAKTVIDTGDSRGAMTNFGVQSYATAFNRTMVYNDINDPCIEHAVAPGPRTALKLPGIAKYLGVEVVELAKAIKDYDADQLLPIAKTARFSPAFWLHQASTGLALFKGEAGTFIDHIPGNSVTAVGLFDNSPLNQSAEWRRRLQPFTNVFAYSQSGSHLSLARWGVQLRTINRVELVQEQLATVRSADELNVEAVVREAIGSVTKLSA